MLDVIVIGGGPCGSQTAYRLSAAGYRVVVLERKAWINAKPCTGIISQECVSKYSIPDDVIYRKVNSARILAPTGDCIRVHRPEAQACIINRQAFDILLAERAQTQGAEYRFNSKASQVIPQKDKIVIQIEEKRRSHMLEAKAVILANGFSSPLVHQLGLGKPGYFTAGVQADVKVNGIDEVEVYLSQKIAPGFFAWLVPTAEGKGLAGLMCRHSPGYYLREFIRKLEVDGKVKQEVHSIQYAGIPLRTLGRTYGTRLMVVGDAAGQVKPTTGGGIYFGLICADMAAQNLQDAFRFEDLSASRLSNYQKDWRRKLVKELRREYAARRLYELLNDGQISRLLAALNNNGIVDSLLKEETLSFDWHGGLLLKALRLGVAAQIKHWKGMIRH